MSKAIDLQHDAFYCGAIMLEAFGGTQKNILVALRTKRDGLTADQLAEKFSITRTAIRQHMAVLEELGYAEQGLDKGTGGRPAILYRLSEKGFDLFPKQYAWFSELLMQTIGQEIGKDRLAEWMEKIGKSVGKSMLPQLENKEGQARIDAILALMNQLAYEAESVPMRDSAGGKGVEAKNCVYHGLASRFPDVCKFDLALLETLSGQKIDHTSCMVRGGVTCRFAFKGPKR